MTNELMYHLPHQRKHPLVLHPADACVNLCHIAAHTKIYTNLYATTILPGETYTLQAGQEDQTLPSPHTMWHHQLFPTAQAAIQGYRLLEHDQPLSYRDVIGHLQASSAFRTYWNQLLAQVPFEAFFWEVKPVTQTSLHEPFEFVLVNSTALCRIQADVSAFTAELQRHPDQPVVSFHNLGKDALLIVPQPLGDTKTYTHLASFTRNAPSHQTDALWQMVGQLYAEQIHMRTQPTWLSTAGLGVHWLHIRLDQRPKYYRHRAYQVAPV